MIIGINGKIGSCKDTVGKIIQYLQCHNTGEITIQDVMSNPEHEWWLEEQSKFEIKKFAGKLKQIGSILSGVSVEKFEDQEFKKLNMGKEWNSPYNIPFSGPDFVEHDGAMTYREFLQRLGTEAMREGLHTNVWVNALFADYKESPQNVLGNEGYKLEDVYPNWIITDMRFPNELEAVIKNGGITIRVTRSCGSSNFEGTQEEWDKLVEKNKQALHPSETALDNAKFDYEIINDGTIEDLVEKVKEILTEQGII
jgi:hypothetical protein